MEMVGSVGVFKVKQSPAIKAYCISNGENSIIVFHTSPGKAKALARTDLSFEDNEYIELTAKRTKAADKHKTIDPSVLLFCENDEIYHELDWYCSTTGECTNDDCALWGCYKGELL